MRPGLRAALVLAATVAGVTLTVRLGVWQLARAQQKLDLQAAIEARGSMPPLTTRTLAASGGTDGPQLYRRVRLRGRWDAGHTVYLDNRQMNGHPGFYVLTPLRLEGRSDAVIVQRGWIPRDFIDRAKLHVPETDAGPVELDGRIAPPPSRLFDFGPGESGPIRQNLDLAAFAGETGLQVLPWSVLQLDTPGAPADGLLRDWPASAVDASRNEGYAFQWFALAALMTGLYVWFQLLRPRLHRAG
jgi:surfeit locus 1 family protein